jgi:hypothetical protein
MFSDLAFRVEGKMTYTQVGVFKTIKDKVDFDPLRSYWYGTVISIIEEVMTTK